jgi:hypothetical protein
MCFQVQPFSRLMPSSFSVSSARVFADGTFAESMDALLGLATASA